MCCCNVAGHGEAGRARRWARRARRRAETIGKKQATQLQALHVVHLCIALQCSHLCACRRNGVWGDGCVVVQSDASASEEIKYGGHDGARRRRIRPRGNAPARGQMVQRRRIMRAHFPRFWSFHVSRICAAFVISFIYHISTYDWRGLRAGQSWKAQMFLDLVRSSDREFSILVRLREATNLRVSAHSRC